MIYVDVSEKPYVHKAFKKFFGNNYKKKFLGMYDCKDLNIPLFFNKKLYCISEKLEDEIITLVNSGYIPDRKKCVDCKMREYVRIADIEIGENRAFYERKRADDFAKSQKDRLYLQMNNIDTFIQGRKGIILEGMGDNYFKFEDSYFSDLKEDLKGKQDISKLSPIQQAIYFSGNKNWTMSFIRECKMRDMEFVQTYDLNETIEFIDACNDGYDEEPKIRLIPKRHKKLSIEQDVLAVFDGIGEKRSAQILQDYKSIPIFLNALKEMSIEDVKKHRFFKQLYEVFILGGKINGE